MKLKTEQDSTLTMVIITIGLFLIFAVVAYFFMLDTFITRKEVEADKKKAQQMFLEQMEKVKKDFDAAKEKIEEMKE